MLWISGVSSAKLVAQKSKGMPRITIPLTKLVDASASEAMSNLSLSLFKAFKNIKCSLVEGYIFLFILLHQSFESYERPVLELTVTSIYCALRARTHCPVDKHDSS